MTESMLRSFCGAEKNRLLRVATGMSGTQHHSTTFCTDVYTIPVFRHWSVALSTIEIQPMSQPAPSNVARVFGA